MKKTRDAIDNPFGLIDKRQEVHRIRDAVRWLTDEDSSKGKFIMTGSAMLNKNLYVHLGMGRIAHLE